MNAVEVTDNWSGELRVFTRNLLLAVLLTTSTFAVADAPRTARGLIENGLAAYVKSGANDAINTWLTGSALEGNTQATTQANSLRQIEDFYGKALDGNYLKEVTVSPRVRIAYFTINYERGVAFSRFNVYQKADGSWIVLSFAFHTEAAQVFPRSMLSE